MKFKHVKLILGGLALFAGGICAGHLISAKKAKKSSKSERVKTEDDPLLKYYKDGDEDPFYDESLFDTPTTGNHVAGHAADQDACDYTEDDLGYDTAGGLEGYLKDEYSLDRSNFRVKGDKTLWPDSPERLNPKYLPDLYAKNFGDSDVVDPFVAFSRGLILGYREANSNNYSLSDLGDSIDFVAGVRVFISSAYDYVLKHSKYVQRYAGTGPCKSPYTLFIAGYHAAFDIYFDRQPECAGICELHCVLRDLLTDDGYRCTNDEGGSIFGEAFDPDGDAGFRTNSEEDYKLNPDDFEELYNKTILFEEDPFDFFVTGYREGYTKATEELLGWKDWLNAPENFKDAYLRQRFDVHCPDETYMDNLSEFIAGYHAAYDDVFARNPELITGTDGFHHQLYDFMFNEDSIWDMVDDNQGDNPYDEIFGEDDPGCHVDSSRGCRGNHSCGHCRCHSAEPKPDDAFTFDDVSAASYTNLHKDDDMHKESSYFMDLYLYYFDAVCDPNAIFPGSAFEKGYCEGYTDATGELDGWKAINKAPTKEFKDFVASRWTVEEGTSEYIERIDEDGAATPYSAFVAGYHAAYDDVFGRYGLVEPNLCNLMHEDTIAANNYMNLDDSDTKESAKKESNEFFNFDAARKLAGEAGPAIESFYMDTDSGAGVRSPKINGGDFAKNENAIDLEDEFEDLSTTRDTDVHESRNEHAIVGQKCKKCRHCPYTCDCSECICGGPCLGCKDRNEFEPLESNESTDADAFEDEQFDTEDEDNIPTSTEEFFNEDEDEDEFGDEITSVFEDVDEDITEDEFGDDEDEDITEDEFGDDEDEDVSEDELHDGSDIEEDTYELEEDEYATEEIIKEESEYLCDETEDETSVDGNTDNREENNKGPKITPATDALGESEKLDDDWG